MYYLAQSLPLSEATADKLLGANFLSLALIALVMVVAMFLLFVWMNNRRQAADDKRQEAYDKRQDAFLKTVIGDESPLVQAQKKVASILEKSEERSEQRTVALESLGEKTDTQTAAINNQTRVIEVQNLNHNSYQTLVSDNLSDVAAKTEANTASIEAFKTDMSLRMDHMSEQIEEILKDRSDCAGFRTEWRAFREDVLERLQPPVNAISNTVIVPEQTLTVNVSADVLPDEKKIA